MTFIETQLFIINLSLNMKVYEYFNKKLIWYCSLFLIVLYVFGKTNNWVLDKITLNMQMSLCIQATLGR